MIKLAIHLPHKEITILVKNGSKFSNILQYLQEKHSITIRKKTLACCLKEWNISYQQRNDNLLELQAHITWLFFNCYLSDAEILYDLEKEGYSINLTGLQ